MKIDELSKNGIDTLVQAEPAIVQIIDRTYIDRQGMKFIQYLLYSYLDPPSVMVFPNFKNVSLTKLIFLKALNLCMLSLK